MKKLLLLGMAVMLVGCGEPSVDLNLGPQREPDGREHVWSKWKSFSVNPDYDSEKESKRSFAKIPHYQGCKCALCVMEKIPKYVPTTGELHVAYQTRTCSKCNKVGRN